jgi:hypothetical protein
MANNAVDSFVTEAEKCYIVSLIKRKKEIWINLSNGNEQVMQHQFHNYKQHNVKERYIASIVFANKGKK